MACARTVTRSNADDRYRSEARFGSCRRHRRLDRGRVCLRARGAGVARGPGADPRVRLHGDRAGRGGQCRQQRGRARRGRAPRLAGWARRAGASGRTCPCPPGGASGAGEASRFSDRGQDAHPGRWYPLGQAAGRADRSHVTAAGNRAGAHGDRAGGTCRGDGRGCSAGLGLRVRAGHTRAGPRDLGARDARERSRCSSIHAMR